MITISNLSKNYDKRMLLEKVSLAINRGEKIGLIGPNGAGKTTLFNILTGLYQSDGGKFLFSDIEYDGRSKPHILAKAGIARTFQNIRLFANMNILENVMVGCHHHSHTGIWGAITRHKNARNEEQQITQRAAELLAYVGINRAHHMLAKNLSYGEQRRLEIARALATNPKLLALDEPAAGMNATETESLKSLLQTIRSNGVTVLLIEHDVKLVMGLCDRITVLDYGKKIAEGMPNEVRNNPAVIAAYLGTEIGV